MRIHELKRTGQAICLLNLGIVAGALGSTATATELPPSESRRVVVVGFSDLNLSDPDEVSELYRRISAAAQRLCTDRNTPTRYWSKTPGECKRAAIADAVATIHNDRLTALHREKSGRGFG